MYVLPYIFIFINILFLGLVANSVNFILWENKNILIKKITLAFSRQHFQT